MKAGDAEYAQKLEVKTEIEEAAYGLGGEECDEVLDWLATLNLSGTSKRELERKLREVKERSA